jgi:hypothetical protein
MRCYSRQDQVETLAVLPVDSITISGRGGLKILEIVG